VRSTGDFLDSSLKLRAQIESGEYLGAQFFTCGPLFTAPGGHPLELLKYMPESQRKSSEQQFVRLPKSADEARQQVDTLKTAGVDCIKSVLESGSSLWGLFNRLDTHIYDAVVAQAAKDNLPSATHTGNAADVKDAADAGTNSVEHGSIVDLIPGATFAEMQQKGIAYDPTLSVYEAVVDWRTGNPEPLERSLVQQVGPSDLLSSTRAMLQKENREPVEHFSGLLERLNQNLRNAYKAGVLLITGSDAGNTMVIHGPTVQHELELWVKAGIPCAAALQAATYNAAKILRAEDHIGSIQPGRDATMILLDGDPLQDISNTEHISLVMFRGERVSRSELFHQQP
jgi:imidazolonepropionase-like amidohydrolase